MIDTDVIVGDAWSRGLDVPRWHRGNLDPLRAELHVERAGRGRIILGFDEEHAGLFGHGLLRSLGARRVVLFGSLVTGSYPAGFL